MPIKKSFDIITSLAKYKSKRNFNKTAEPAGDITPLPEGHRFVVQKHAATRLHYDFRLELNGTLKSWAVPKGPSLNPQDKRLAVHVEDHPLEYRDFEGIIPKGEYGGGTVIVWDQGTWEPIGDADKSYAKGHLKFRLEGEKLHGEWSLVKMHGSKEERQENWLLMKVEDAFVSLEDIEVARPESVLTKKTIEDIKANPSKVWKNAKAQNVTSSKTDITKKRQNAQKKSSNSANALQKVANTIGKQTIMPAMVEPELATLIDTLPNEGEWLHEIKFDGYRILARIDSGKIQLVTRRKNDWTNKFPNLVQALTTLPIEQAWLDGEIVIEMPNGTTSFQELQNAINENKNQRIVYYLFDLLYLNGRSLLLEPLIKRKELLQQLIIASGNKTIRFSDHVLQSGEPFFHSACQMSLEGIIAKRSDSTYQSRRTRDWLKLKCMHRQEFVICGFTAPQGSRKGIGALLLGIYDEQQHLVYCGKVGTGFTEASLQGMSDKLHAITQKDQPFFIPISRALARGVTWVKPILVGEVEFAQWTDENVLRHASFQGLREDKDPREVIREQAISVGAIKKSSDKLSGSKTSTLKSTRSSAKIDASQDDELPNSGDRNHNDNDDVSSVKNTTLGKSAHPKTSTKKTDSIEIASVKISHASKVLYIEENITKGDIAEYYSAVANYCLPHIMNRPLTLVRCPDGRTKQCFFQKHAPDHLSENLHSIEVEEKEGEIGTYLTIESEAGLMELVQMGVLEIHVGGARSDRINYPDRLIFDLDPDEGLSWEKVIEAAILLRDLFASQNLTTFVKTTGGKGLHVVLPIERKYPWPQAKAFAKAIAESLVKYDSKSYIAKMSKASRTGKIFVDYLRNSSGATAVASFSTRARPGATVATPIHWDELDKSLDPKQFTLKTVPQRLQNLKNLKTEPWPNFEKIKNVLSKALLDTLELNQL